MNELTFALFCVNIVLTMGYCHFVNVKRIQDLASAGFFVTETVPLITST